MLPGSGRLGGAGGAGELVLMGTGLFGVVFVFDGDADFCFITSTGVRGRLNCLLDPSILKNI